jgi:hypothetical protein
MDKCANCERVIGKLETPCVFSENVVCATCHGFLTAQQKLGRRSFLPHAPIQRTAQAEDGWQAFTQSASGPSSSIPYARPSTNESSLDADGPLIICPNPNCGYRGPGDRQSKGSGVIAVLLLLLWILPGLLYILFWSGYVVKCPQCGMKVRDES